MTLPPQSDVFTWAYIDCALWSSLDDDGVPLDTNHDATDLAPETLERMKADCAAFKEQNWESIIGFTPIRVVCQNTLSMPHGSDASKLIRVKHTKDVLENLSNIRELMDVANAQFEATAEQYRRLARTSINQADLRRYVKMVFKVETDQEASTRLQNIMEEIVGLAEAGRGNNLPSVSGTLWTAYNGVSEWLGYQRGHSRGNRLNSLWFGDGANLSRHALEIALAMAA